MMPWLVPVKYLDTIKAIFLTTRIHINCVHQNSNPFLHFPGHTNLIHIITLYHLSDSYQALLSNHLQPYSC